MIGSRMHALSNKPRKKNPRNSPKIFIYLFIYFLNNMEKTSYAKIRSNMCVLNDAIKEKQSLDLLFLSSPKIPARFSQENTKGGKHN